MDVATTMSTTLPMISTKRKREDDSDKDRIYTCKTCNKEFFSFQALGGHRAAHNNRIKNEDDMALGTVSKKPHKCLHCSERFVSGQALGGHVRKHREVMEEKAKTDVLPKRKILSEFCREDKSLRMADTDLVKKREMFVGEGSKLKTTIENFKDKALRLLADPDSVLKSGRTFEKKFVEEEPRCNCRSRLVTRDFFSMEPLCVKKTPVVTEPFLEEHRSWLELKLGPPGGD